MKKVKDPTPAEIAKRAAKIRASWSEDETIARRFGMFTHRKKSASGSVRLEYWNEKMRQLFRFKTSPYRYDEEGADGSW